MRKKMPFRKPLPGDVVRHKGALALVIGSETAVYLPFPAKPCKVNIGLGKYRIQGQWHASKKMKRPGTEMVHQCFKHPSFLNRVLIRAGCRIFTSFADARKHWVERRGNTLFLIPGRRKAGVADRANLWCLMKMVEHEEWVAEMSRSRSRKTSPA